MIMETLAGGILGGISRLAPEVMGFLDRKNERKHEIQMLAANVEADKARTADTLSVQDAVAANEQFNTSVKALQEAVAAQGQKTGNAILDGINVLVRPTVTYIVFAMWVTTKVIMFKYYASTDISLMEIVKVWWDPADQAMLAAILNFWFMGRVFDKALR